jgi:cell wall-associated NlpC family hydrolase
MRQTLIIGLALILRAMLAPKRITAALVALLFAASVQASPPTAGDDLDQLLSEKGLLARIDQVRQSVGEKASELVFTAMGFLGVPYRRGGSTVESGFDCSGFVKAMYEQTVGLILPRKAEQQAAITQKIDRADLLPGDLVFFNTMRRAFSHVGIYIGEGKFIHSPKPGSEVRVDDMAGSYWSRRFDGARRVPTVAPETPALQTSQVTEPALH